MKGSDPGAWFDLMSGITGLASDLVNDGKYIHLSHTCLVNVFFFLFQVIEVLFGLAL